MKLLVSFQQLLSAVSEMLPHQPGATDQPVAIGTRLNNNRKVGLRGVPSIYPSIYLSICLSVLLRKDTWQRCERSGAWVSLCHLAVVFLFSITGRLCLWLCPRLTVWEHTQEFFWITNRKHAKMTESRSNSHKHSPVLPVQEEVWIFQDLLFMWRTFWRMESWGRHWSTHFAGCLEGCSQLTERGETKL